MNIHTLDPYR